MMDHPNVAKVFELVHQNGGKGVSSGNLT